MNKVFFRPETGLRVINQLDQIIDLALPMNAEDVLRQIADHLGCVVETQQKAKVALDLVEALTDSLRKCRLANLRLIKEASSA